MSFIVLIPVAAAICIKMKQLHCFYLNIKNLTIFSLWLRLAENPLRAYVLIPLLI